MDKNNPYDDKSYLADEAADIVIGLDKTIFWQGVHVLCYHGLCDTNDIYLLCKTYVLDLFEPKKQVEIKS